MLYKIDINCDVGEGIGNEALLMPYLSSCNIACAAHAGNEKIIDEVIALAKTHNVKIGAHPSFPDRENFGRNVMDISTEDLQQSIEAQILLLMNKTQLQGMNLHHIKPHGALYNLIAIDNSTARAVVEAVKRTIPHAYLFVPSSSVIERVAIENGVNIKYEAFADRNYNPDLSLISRTDRNAMITNKVAVLAHLEEIIIHKRVNTIKGYKTIKADTICVHGDTENAVELVTYIHQQLTLKNIQIV